MVKHLHTLAHRALEANNRVFHNIIRIQYNLSPLRDLTEAQHMLDQMKKTLTDIQTELTRDSALTHTNTHPQLK